MYAKVFLSFLGVGRLLSKGICYALSMKNNKELIDQREIETLLNQARESRRARRRWLRTRGARCWFAMGKNN